MKMQGQQVMQASDPRLRDMKRSIKEAEARLRRSRGGQDVDEDWCRVPLCEEARGHPAICAGYCTECARERCHHEGCLEMCVGAPTYCSKHMSPWDLHHSAMDPEVSEEEFLQRWMEESVIEATLSPSPERTRSSAPAGREDFWLDEIDEFGSAAA